LRQNSLALDKSAQADGLTPKVHQAGDDYLVVEFVGSPDARTKEMVRKLNELDVTRLVGKVGGIDAHEAEISKAAAILKKYGYNGDALVKRNPLWQDVMEVKNWGTKKDGRPVLVDEGALDGEVDS
jgi:hypothetical protein